MSQLHHKLTAIFVLIVQFCFCQNYKTYEAYHISNGKDLIVDSASADTSLLVLIDFPEHKTDSGFSGMGRVRYIRTMVDDTCHFNVKMELSTDSLYITTDVYSYSYDACNGHLDVSDVVWPIFDNPIHSVYTRRNDHLIFIRDKQIVMVLRPI